MYFQPLEITSVDHPVPFPLGMHEISKDVLNLVFEGVSVNSSYQSNSTIKDPGTLPFQTGNKTECALLEFVNSYGGDYKLIRAEYPEQNFGKVFPFNSTRKSMSTIVRTDDSWRLHCKGAFEVVFSKSV